MTVAELAKECRISTKQLIKKAKLLQIYPSGPKDILNDQEMMLLAKVANWNSAQIIGFGEGLKNKNAQEKLEWLKQSANDFSMSELDKKILNVAPTVTAIPVTRSSDFKKIESRLHKIENKINKSEGKIKLIETKINKLESEIEFLYENSPSNTETLDEMKLSLEIVQTSLLELESEVLPLVDLQDDINTVSNQIEDLNEKVESLNKKDESKKVKNLSDRISNAINQSYKSKVPLPPFKKSKEIQEAYIRKGLAIPEQLIQEIIIGLRQKNIILIGPPGIGKTSLIENLHLFFESPSDKIHLPYHSVTPSWDNYDVLGGKTLLDSKLVPHLGVFTECVINCIESKRTTFLLLDELNRGKADDMFSGLMDWLNSKNRTLKFKELGLVGEKKQSIRVPDNLRIIGAMNNSDQQFLYSMSSQLKRRFIFINFSKPDIAAERRVLNRLVSSINRSLKRKKKVTLFDDILKIVDTIRALEKELKLEETLVGTSYIVSTFRQIEQLTLAGYHKSIDELFKENLLDCFIDTPPNIKQAFMSKIFIPFKLNVCSEKLSSKYL